MTIQDLVSTLKLLHDEDAILRTEFTEELFEAMRSLRNELPRIILLLEAGEQLADAAQHSKNVCNGSTMSSRVCNQFTDEGAETFWGAVHRLDDTLSAYKGAAK